MRTGLSLSLSFNNSCPLSLSVFTEDEEVYGWKERKRCDSSCWLVSLCKLLCLSWRMSKINEKHLQGKEKLKDEKHFHCLLLLYPQVFSYFYLWFVSLTSILFDWHVFLPNNSLQLPFSLLLLASLLKQLLWKKQFSIRGGVKTDTVSDFTSRMKTGPNERSKEAFLPVFLLRDPCISFTTGCSLWINLSRDERKFLWRKLMTHKKVRKDFFQLKKAKNEERKKRETNLRVYDTVSFWLMIDFSLWFLPI